MTIISLRYFGWFTGYTGDHCSVVDRSPCYVCRSGLVILQFNDFLAMLCLHDGCRSLANCLGILSGGVFGVIGAFLAPLVTSMLSDCIGHCDGDCSDSDSFVLCQSAWQRYDSLLVIITVS